LYEVCKIANSISQKACVGPSTRFHRPHIAEYCSHGLKWDGERMWQ